MTATLTRQLKNEPTIQPVAAARGRVRWSPRRPVRRRSSSRTSASGSWSAGTRSRSTRSRDVSMRLERGEIHGILGANGSGKSTLIRLISGLLTLDEGRVEVFGHDIERDEMAVKRLINRVSVDAAFFKKLSPMENLLFAARLYGLDGKTAQARGDRDPGPAGHRREAARPARRADEPGDAAEGRDRASPADEPDPAAPRRADHRPRPALEARRPVLHRGAPGRRTTRRSS